MCSRSFTLWIVLCGCSVFPAISAQAAPWTKDFQLKEYMRIYDFPEELLSYPVVFPKGQVRRRQLELTLQGEQPQSVPFQLSDVVEQKGFLSKATLHFRSDLPKGATRTFRLTHGTSKKRPDFSSRVGLQNFAGETAVLAANLLRVKVPFGEQFYPEPVPLSKVPAPILAVARGGLPCDWCLAGSLRAGPALKVIGLKSTVIDEGPLFAKYRIAYTFNKGQQYIVVLTLRHNETYVTIDETFGGIQASDEAYLRINFTPGLDPDRREVMSNGGYNAQGYLGEFEKNVDASGKLPFELGLNRPNSMGVMRSAAFFKDKGQHSLLLSLYRLRDWKTLYRHVWYSNSGPGNLNFYSGGKEKYMLTRLEGQARYWALALIPRDKQVHVRNTPGGKGRGPAGGPEVRLWQKLADFSLNQVKDWVFEWDESLKKPQLFPEGDTLTYDKWHGAYGMDSVWWFLNAIVNFYWDFSAEVGPPSYGLMPEFFGVYERSRDAWTPEERKHVRAILLFLTYTAEDDNNLPHHSMLAGQPNFVMQVKQTIAIACGVFPNHPHAKRWRDSFMKFHGEWLEVYGRKADRQHNALGGRWTENIACYSGTSMQAMLRCAKGLKILDGTDLLKHPMVHDWVEWYLNSLMSPHAGVRRVPPEGAHATAFNVGGGYWNDLFEVARRIENSAPELSARMRWIETSGKQGVKPELKSVLIRDYGPVLRHDFGGPRESYLHLMQTSGHYNYRWGQGSGVLYYGAKNKNWSSNGSEDNGDSFNISRVSAFSVDGQGLGYHPTDQPLYDFDFAQFYRAVADPNVASQTKYNSRGVMLLRDDYFIVFDDVEGQAAGQFTWSSGGQMPQLQQLRPGVAFDKASTDSLRHYRGQGDFLTLIAPEQQTARATEFGALVGKDEYVLCRDSAFDFKDANVSFEGTVGYARPKQLALFEGTRLSSGDFKIERQGGDFGISAAIDGKTIVGRVAGRKGGRVSVVPPWKFEADKLVVRVGGRAVPVEMKQGMISFQVELTLANGYKQYAITF